MRGLSSSHGGTRLGLNPCFNGICSMSLIFMKLPSQKLSLNPCFNGICSMSVTSPRGTFYLLRKS